MNFTWLYVAVVFFAAIAIARRSSALRVPWRMSILFYLLVLIFFFRPMTQQTVNVPVDFLRLLNPWSDVMRVHVSNREANDVTLQMVPWAHAVREEWMSLRLPLWNQYSGSGSILLANGQSAAMSPLRIVTLPLSLGHAFTAEAAMKLLMAMCGMFLFCRRRYSETASAVGSISYGFCTFLICWLHFPHSTTAAYAPAALLVADLLVERATRARIAFGALVWGTILLSGHPETATHIFFLTMLMLIWIVAVERAVPVQRLLRFVGALAAMSVLALLIASPFLLSFAESLRKSHRYMMLATTPHEALFTSIHYAIALLQPHFYGPNEQEAWGKWWAGAEAVSGFAGVFGGAGWVALLIDAIRYRRWRTREMFFVVALPVLIAIIFNWPLIGDAFHAVFAMAANARVRVLLCVVVAACAAAAFDRAERNGSVSLLAGVLVVAIALACTVFLSRYPFAWARDNAILEMLPTLLMLVTATWFATARTHRLAATIALLFAITVEMFAAGRYWNAVVDEKHMYPTTPLIQKLQLLTSASNPPARFVGIDAALFPNSSVIYGLEDIRAHDPMANGKYLGLLRVLSGYTSEDYFGKWYDTETPLLDYLSVRYVVTDATMDLPEDRYRLVYTGDDGRIYENRRVLPRFYPARNVILEFKKEEFKQQILKHRGWRDTALVDILPVENDQMRRDLLWPRPVDAPMAKLHITHATPRSFTMKVSAPRYTLVVSSQPLWPGWRVRLNGKRILTRPVNHAFLGFTVPPGESEVVVDYFPLHIYVAFWVAVLTVILCVWFVSRGDAEIAEPYRNFLFSRSRAS